MTAAHPVRRLLQHICSAETMARLVDPTLADMRTEPGRPAWQGYLALARALTLHAVISIPGAMARAWRDDDHMLPRALAVNALATAVLASPLIAIPAKSALHISWYAIVLLAPQALGVSLPMSLLVAIPLVFRRASPGRRLLLPALVLSTICAVATCVVMFEMIPDANQAFRVEVTKQIDPSLVHLPRGPIEMTLHELREQIEVLRLTQGGVVAARRLEYTLQMKLAMSAIALPLGLLAIAITIVARGRARSVAMGTVSAFVYVYGIFALDSWTVNALTRSEAFSPAGLAWAPTILVLALAVGLLWKSRMRMAAPCA